MTRLLDERYILRSEHQQIIAYYKKLIVQMHRKLGALRDQVHAMPPVVGVSAAVAAEPFLERFHAPAPPANVTRVDFRLRKRRDD